MVAAAERLKDSWQAKEMPGTKEPAKNVRKFVPENPGTGKEPASLLGRVTLGAIKVGLALTSTQSLVTITLLGVAALFLALSLPGIKTLLIGVPLFVGLARLTTSEGAVVFGIAKLLTLIGLACVSSDNKVDLKSEKKLSSSILDFVSEWLSSRKEEKANEPITTHYKQVETPVTVERSVSEADDSHLEEVWAKVAGTSTSKDRAAVIMQHLAPRARL
ncbi:MAG: hypothetical protein ChlgKO_08920 [Chlamydiales bacterium]